MSANQEGIEAIPKTGGDAKPESPVRKPTKREILDAMADRVNARTKNIKLKVSRRYDYYAIDMYSPNGNVIDTLVAGMNARETEDILSAIERMLFYEATSALMKEGRT
jgi:RNA polymerase-interacting CarD/CdnL/TRCF family regulator